MSQPALLAMLVAHAPYVSAVGDRHRFGRLPQSLRASGTCVRIDLISTVRESAMGTDTGLVRSRYQLTVHDADYLTALTTRGVIRAAVQRKRGTYASVIVQDVFLENETDAYDPEPEGASGGQGEHQLMTDIEMIYQES